MHLKFRTPMMIYQLDLVRWKIFGAFTKDCLESRRREIIEPCKGNRWASMIGAGPLFRYSIQLSDVEADEYLQIG